MINIKYVYNCQFTTSEQSVPQQKIMTVPAIITVIAVVIYMIVSEIF